MALEAREMERDRHPHHILIKRNAIASKSLARSDADTPLNCDIQIIQASDAAPNAFRAEHALVR
jgi:hypothetical protein